MKKADCLSAPAGGWKYFAQPYQHFIQLFDGDEVMEEYINVMRFEFYDDWEIYSKEYD